MPKKRNLILAASTLAALAVPVVTDRAVAASAENRLAARLGCLAGDTRDLDVSLGGFPFLTQVASGTFTDVRVRAAAVTFRGLTLSRIDVTAHGVRLPERGQAYADSVVAEAIVAYSGLATVMSGKPGRPGKAGGPLDLATAELGGDGAGRLTITTALSVRGTEMPATVYAGLALADGELSIIPEEIELARFGLRIPASRLPAGAGATRTVPLPDLPAGVAYRAITATPEGLALTVTGSGLTSGAGGTASTTIKTCGGTAG